MSKLKARESVKEFTPGHNLQQIFQIQISGQHILCPFYFVTNYFLWESISYE